MASQNQFNRMPPELGDMALLRMAAEGNELECDKLLCVLKDMQPRSSKTTNYVVLSSLFHFCTENSTRISCDEFWLAPSTLEVISYLLSYASPNPGIDAAFYRTMASQHADSPQASELLANSTTKSAFNLSLNSLSLQPVTRYELWETQALIEWGADSEPVRLAFCISLYQNRNNYNSTMQDFLRELIASGLDIVSENFECLRTVSDCGNYEILEQLLDSPYITTNNLALSIILTVTILAGHEDKLLQTMLDSFVKRYGSATARKMADGESLHLFEFLQLYPNSPQLARSLLQLGCSVNSHIQYPYLEIYGIGDESITVLLRALYQVVLGSELQVSNEVLDILIARGDVNFQTPSTGTTPLIIATKFRRHDIVSKLVGKNANGSAKDLYERSALFYASRNGDLNSVVSLLHSKVPPNDGSLHEAARKLHSEVVAAITDIRRSNKHDPFFASSAHDHRTPLNEMLLKCKADQMELSRVENTLRSLSRAMRHYDNNFQMGGEELFLALNNPQPITLLKALINCGLFQREQFQSGQLVKGFLSGNGVIYYYSLTLYSIVA